MAKKTFTVTDQHIKLMRSAVVGWDGCEFGAPSINCKRPYGNSWVYGDIAEILGIRNDNGDNVDCGEFTDEQTSYMNRVHQETKASLQIFLSTGEMKAGNYCADEFKTNWKPMDEQNCQRHKTFQAGV